MATENQPETVKPRRKVGAETLLTRQITAWLKKQPNTWYFKISGNPGGAAGFGIAQKRGVPDLCVIHYARTYWFEAKTQTGVLSDVQKKVHVEMRAAGASVWVVRSLEEVQAVLAGQVIEVEYIPTPVIPKTRKAAATGKVNKTVNKKAGK